MQKYRHLNHVDIMSAKDGELLMSSLLFHTILTPTPTPTSKKKSTSKPLLQTGLSTGNHVIHIYFNSSKEKKLNINTYFAMSLIKKNTVLLL